MAPTGPDIRLSLAITHSDARPDRRAMLNEMVRKMGGADGLNRDTAHWQVTKDQGWGLWGTHWRSWAAGMVAAGATHHMVMEDDLLLCADFLAGVKEVLRHAPHGPVSLYANRAVIDVCRERDVHWARIEDGMWGQCLILPSEQVTEFIRWDREHLRPHVFAYDSRLTMWGLATKKPVWCTAPSLVEHAGASVSTIGYSNRNRVARWFIGSDVSALSVDWSVGVEDPPRDQDKRLSWPGYQGIWKVAPDGLYR